MPATATCCMVPTVDSSSTGNVRLITSDRKNESLAWIFHARLYRFTTSEIFLGIAKIPMLNDAISSRSPLDSDPILLLDRVVYPPDRTS